MSASSTADRDRILRQTTHAFCKALLNPPPPPDLVGEYFISGTPRITEHGPAWATSRLPFLAKTFAGREQCEEYFQVLASILEMDLGDNAFPGVEGFIVDSNAEIEWVDGNQKKKCRGVVSVVGQGSFKSIKTRKGWHEQFIYRFSDFDDNGKIGHWEVWADPLSAWDAVGSD